MRKALTAAKPERCRDCAWWRDGRGKLYRRAVDGTRDGRCARYKEQTPVWALGWCPEWRERDGGAR